MKNNLLGDRLAVPMFDVWPALPSLARPFGSVSAVGPYPPPGTQEPDRPRRHGAHRWTPWSAAAPPSEVVGADRSM